MDIERKRNDYLNVEQKGRRRTWHSVIIRYALNQALNEELHCYLLSRQQINEVGAAAGSRPRMLVAGEMWSNGG